MIGKAVHEHQRLPGAQMRRDFGGVDIGHHFVRRAHDEHVARLCGFGDGDRRRNRPPAPVRRDARRVKRHDHIDARIAQVKRVRMALRAVADHGDALGLDQRRIGVALVETRIMVFLRAVLRL